LHQYIHLAEARGTDQAWWSFVTTRRRLTRAACVRHLIPFDYRLTAGIRERHWTFAPSPLFRRGHLLPEIISAEMRISTRGLVWVLEL